MILLSKKKSYTRERWGFNKASVSFDSDADPQSPTFEMVDSGNNRPKVEPTSGTISGATTEDTPTSNSSNDVNFRPAKAERPISANRLSKVLANVSFFESKADGKEGDSASEDSAKIGSQKASIRKRAPYLQVS